MTQPNVQLTGPTQDTVLPSPPEEVSNALESALLEIGDERRVALAAVAKAHPEALEPWARLSAVARDPLESYAYARVGYHRGLDLLRRSGWKGSGFVRWSAPTNRQFLRALDALRVAANAIGETDEVTRCELFLRQLDPDWKGVDA